AGYRVGTLAAGAGTLIAADRYGWRVAYICMAALMMIGALSAILAPEPESDRIVRRDHPGFAATIIAPIKELAGRLIKILAETLTPHEALWGAHALEDKDRQRGVGQ